MLKDLKTMRIVLVVLVVMAVLAYSITKSQIVYNMGLASLIVYNLITIGHFYAKRNFYHDFWDGNGLVRACRHRNPDGSRGGWVAKTAYVAETAYVGPFARVYENARVVDNARVEDYADVHGNAIVIESAILSDFVNVYGEAMVFGWAKLSGEVIVRGKARIYENLNQGIYGTLRSKNGIALRGFPPKHVETI